MADYHRVAPCHTSDCFVVYSLHSVVALRLLLFWDGWNLPLPSIIIILHFISSEPAFWATLPLYSTVDCTVGGSKESRGSTVTLYVYPAAACGGYVGASSSRVTFRATAVFTLTVRYRRGSQLLGLQVLYVRNIYFHFLIILQHVMILLYITMSNVQRQQQKQNCC